MLVWKQLDDFLQLLRAQRRTTTYAIDFKRAIKILIQATKEVWGEKDISFYLVR